jgi:hypothetical protein
MPVRSGDVDRPLGPIKASTKVLERWFVGVSLGVLRRSKDLTQRLQREGGEKSEKDEGVNRRLARGGD